MVPQFDKQKFSAIIFDCDGVLVDSEMLSAGVLKIMMAEQGMPLSDEMFRDVFLGRSFVNGKSRAKAVLNFDLPDDFENNYRERLFKELNKNLQPMPGIHNLIDALKVPYCVATGSSPKRLELSLKVAGLSDHFIGNRFTASEVAHGKPAPDLCYYAAKNMNVAPEGCLVIEDSEMGILAARAAGMEVWHFAGGAHIKAGYQFPKNLNVAKSFADMQCLYVALAEIDVCDQPKHKIK
jgi:HAD superfamily hydrolase (TIGR01509 family)